MNHDSAFGKEIMLELLFGAGPVKYIKMTLKKTSKFPH